MKDFYGYDRNVHENGAVMSSEVATISFGTGGNKRLVQNVNATYNQTATPRYELGSSDLYWNTGHPLGQVNIGRLVGRGGYLSDLTRGEGCGKVASITLGLDGQGGCVTAAAGRSLIFNGAVPVSIGINVGAGSLEVAENLSWQVAKMSDR